MISISRGTKLNPEQIQLDRLFSVDRVLASRGFSVKSEGNGEDTILAKSSWSSAEADLVFEVFDNVLLRKELLSYISDNVAKCDLSLPVSNVVEIDTFKKDRSRFSATFEWYVGELLVRKFKAFSSSYGVTVDDICRNGDDQNAGDFDVLSILGDMNLLYVECKSGALKQRSIRNTIERSISLHCTASVIITQDFTESGLVQQLSFPHPVFGYADSIYKLNIKGRQSSTIYKWFNCYVIHASEVSGDIESKLKAVLRIIEASRSIINMGIEPGDEQYGKIGYEMSVFQPGK